MFCLMLLDSSTMLKNVTIYNEGVDDFPLSFSAALKEVMVRELVDSHSPPHSNWDRLSVSEVTILVFS